MSKSKKFQLRNWELVSINPNNRDWSWKNYFNFWAINIQTIVGFSLISALYLFYDLNFFVVLTGSLLAGLLVFFFANIVGKISQSSGLSFPTILRLSMGFTGARYVGMIRGLVGLFMFGVQTFFISKSLGYIARIILFKIDNQILQNEIFLLFFFGLNLIDWVCLFLTLIFQYILFTKGQNFLKSFINFSGLSIYLGLSVILIVILSEYYNELLNGIKLSLVFSNFAIQSNIAPIISITGTLFGYFAIVLLTFGDFSRYSMNYKEMTKGNLSIILNLIFFSFFSVLITLGSDIILTSKGLNASSLLTNPNDIVGKFNNNFLTFFCLIFIIISSLSTNLIANYIPSQNTLINFFPNSLTLKKTGIVISIIGLIISTFWLSIFSKANVLIFVEAVATTFGPIFGVLVADYYLFKKQQINHKELFYPKEHTEYIYSNGWNLKALYALLIGSIFSLSSLLNENLIQYQSFGWIIGAFASYLVYYLLNNK